MNLDNILIKPAVKGGQIVLQDQTSYLIEANRQLEDKKYYIPLPQPLQPETHQKIQSIVNTLYVKDYINFKQLSYLYGPVNPRQRMFYLLPKIHANICFICCRKITSPQNPGRSPIESLREDQ